MRVLSDGKQHPNTDISVVVTQGITLILWRLSPGHLVFFFWFYRHCFYSKLWLLQDETYIKPISIPPFVIIYLLSAAGVAPLSSWAATQLHTTVPVQSTTEANRTRWDVKE